MEQEGLGMRGAEGGALVNRDLILVAPGNRTAELAISLDDSGQIRAEAWFGRAFETPTEVSLYLVEPSGGWAWLGSNLAQGNRWRLVTPGCQEMLDLPVGNLDGHCFALAEGRLTVRRRIEPELKPTRSVRIPTAFGHLKLVSS
jgi:hypothetical protein